VARGDPAVHPGFLDEERLAADAFDPSVALGMVEEPTARLMQDSGGLVGVDHAGRRRVLGVGLGARVLELSDGDRRQKGGEALSQGGEL